MKFLPSEPESISLYKRPADPASFFEPLVSKVYLELSEPTLDDNVADIDRITRELSKVVVQLVNPKKRMTNIELSNYLPFMNEFMAALFLPNTDTSLFSSVHY